MNPSYPSPITVPVIENPPSAGFFMSGGSARKFADQDVRGKCNLTSSVADSVSSAYPSWFSAYPSWLLRPASDQKPTFNAAA